MKTQKMFVDPNFPIQRLFSQIFEKVQHLNLIQKEIQRKEEVLASHIKRCLLQETLQSRCITFFNLTLFCEQDDGEIYKKSLLDTICIQIAESINRFYKYKETKKNAFINHGGKNYNINSQEICDKFGISDFDPDFFDDFNHQMKRYGVQIKFLSHNKDSIGIHLRIFP